jgi:hypothetical protein
VFETLIKIRIANVRTTKSDEVHQTSVQRDLRAPGTIEPSAPDNRAVERSTNLEKGDGFISEMNPSLF